MFFFAVTVKTFGLDCSNMSNTEGAIRSRSCLPFASTRLPLWCFFVGSVLLILLVVYVVLLCIFTFLVPCCDVRYEFRIKTMFGSSLCPVVCRRAHVLLCFVYVYVYWCPSFCCCSSVWLSVLCFVCLRPVSYVSTAPTQQLFSYTMAKTS
jgi:type IV secretory pathway TrbL component